MNELKIINSSTAVLQMESPLSGMSSDGNSAELNSMESHKGTHARKIVRLVVGGSQNSR